MAGPYNNTPGMPPYYGLTSQPLMTPDQYSHPAFPPALHRYQTLSAEHLNQAYADFDDGARTMLPAQSSVRARRRPQPGSEHVKHRRTRSGCYTCRNRRVKCDETHPICERCRKGNRECVYPEPASGAKLSRSRAGTKGNSPDSGSSADETEGDPKSALPPIQDDDEAAYEASSQPESFPRSSQAVREQSDTPSLTHEKSPSPSTESSNSIIHQQQRPSQPRTATKQALRKSAVGRTWAELPSDVRFYLDFFRKNISHHHYALKFDGADFMRTTFLDIAVHNDPLLFAVVGFAAYHHTLTKSDGRIQDFLKYYNKSVSLLRESLARNQRRTPATLLTILQLATFEEYLGDWVNLIGHQKAAYQIITELYTPETIMQNETLRRIITWYVRFDLFGGLLSGYETVLSRDWFVACNQYYVHQCRDRPYDLSSKFEERLSLCRLFATDVSTLFSRRAKGHLDDDTFSTECEALEQRFEDWVEELDPALIDPSKRIQEFPGAPPLDPDSIVDPYEPNRMFGGDLYPMNITFIDYWAIYIMFKLQLAMAQRTLPDPELVKTSFGICQMVEAVEKYPESPAGIMIEAQASLGIATLFLPKDQRHIMWCRRKFARVEQQGYIYPETFRSRMSATWNEDVSRWWLPDDEGYPRIIRSIRSFIEDRTLPTNEQTKQDLRDMKGLFNELSIKDDSQSPASSTQNASVGSVPSEQELSAADSLAGGLDSDAMIYEGSPEYGWHLEQGHFPEP